MKPVSVWVAPEFRRVLKKKAADADMDMISYTQDLAKKHEDQGKKERRSYEFF